MSGCHIVVHFGIFVELPLGVKGASPSGLRKLFSTACEGNAWIKIGFSHLSCDSKDSPNVVS